MRMSKQSEVFLYFMNYVQKLRRRHGNVVKSGDINTLGSTVQAMLETGYGQHVMYNNWYGIKCTSYWVSHGNKCFDAHTKEDTKDGLVDVVAGFRAYDSISHCLLDYHRIVTELSYYTEAATNHDCVWNYFQGLDGTWATDRKYYEKLVHVTLHCCQFNSVRTQLPLIDKWLGNSFTVGIERGLSERNQELIASLTEGYSDSYPELMKAISEQKEVN